MRGPVLLVEPHYDDAALSCSALLERERPLDVLTVFAGEPDPPMRGYWDEICGFTDSREALTTRAAEGASALAGLPHRSSTLPLLEDQYVEARASGDRVVLADAVREWTSRHADGLVALPAGAGWPARALRRRLAPRRRVRAHPEHLFVRDSALAALEDSWTPVLYEELPYLVGGAADKQVGALAARLGRTSVLVELPVDLPRKAARIAAYRSQVRLISPPELDLQDPSALPAIERYWLLER